MARDTILCKIFTILLLLSSTYTQQENQFFRKDYTFIESLKSFYKVHTVVKNWNKAYEVCEREGAPMFYPEDENEANLVLELFKKKSTGAWSHIGVNSFIGDAIFQTIDGKFISEVYHKWGPGEPNNGGGGHPERCVEIVREGTLNDINCDWIRPFICRKNLSSVEWNYVCDTPYSDYEYDKDIGKCYKLHKEPNSWRNAIAICHAEESNLAIINSKKVAEHFVTLLKDMVLPGGAIHSGFHKTRRGWKTIRATKLENSGYAEWAVQPDDATVGNRTCGTMLSDGKLSHTDCAVKANFICEHQVIACDICELK